MPSPSKNETLAVALGDCARIWRSTANERLRGLGLSQSSWLALWHLSHFPEGLGQTELAEKLGIEAPTLVRSLDRLEKDGLLNRIPSEFDRRCKIVQLTPAAFPVVEQVRSIVAQLRTELLAGISDQQIDLGIELLTRIRERLFAVNSGEVS